MSEDRQSPSRVGRLRPWSWRGLLPANTSIGLAVSARGNLVSTARGTVRNRLLWQASVTVGIYDKLRCWGCSHAPCADRGFVLAATATKTVDACTVPPPRSSAVTCVEEPAGSKEQGGYRRCKDMMPAGTSTSLPLLWSSKRAFQEKNGAETQESSPHLLPRIPRRYEVLRSASHSHGTLQRL